MSVPMSNMRAEYCALKTEIDAAIERVIESGNFIMGQEPKAFEEEFAAYCGAKHAVGVGSGTAALHLALLACGIGPGDEVITVPNTDIPTTMTITHCGADNVWVDVDGRDFNIDPEKIEEKITSKTKAILPVHLFGHPADMDPILEIARRHNLLVIEDGCLAVGAEYKGRTVGSIGDVTAFSLAPTKILGAYGDAGIVTTDRQDIADRIRVLGNYGHSLEMDESAKSALGVQLWKLAAEGFNERLDPLQAAILRAKLPTLDDRIARRRAAARRYDQLLLGLDVVTPYESEQVKHVYRAYTVLVESREQVRAYMASKGISTRVYYIPPLHLQPAYDYLGLRPGDFPVTERTSAEMLSLPMFPEITGGQIAEVVAALGQAVSRFE